MKLTQHLGNGVWAMADKSLPMMYGAAFVLIVAKQMAPHEFGVWVIFQLVWMFVTWVGDNFILQPMVKLAAENTAEQPALFSASFIMYGGFLVLCSAAIWLGGNLWNDLFHARELPALMRWMSAMLLANLFRNLAIRILQIDYEIKKIVLLDIVYFGIVVGIIVWYAAHNAMHEPIKMVYANVYGAIFSSLLGVIIARKKLYFRRAHISAYRQIYRLGVYQGGTGGLQTVQTQMDGLLVGLIRTPTDAAVYQVAKTFFRAFEAIRDGASLLILPMTARLYANRDHEALAALCEKILFLLLLCIVPATLILIAGGQFLFTAIYQGKYDSSIAVFRILTIGALALPFTIIGMNVLLGIGETRPLFRITFVNTVIFLGLMVVLTFPFGAAGAAGALTIASLLYAFTCLRATQNYVKITVKGIISRVSDLKRFLASYLHSN